MKSAALNESTYCIRHRIRCENLGKLVGKADHWTKPKDAVAEIHKRYPGIDVDLSSLLDGQLVKQTHHVTNAIVVHETWEVG